MAYCVKNCSSGIVGWGSVNLEGETEPILATAVFRIKPAAVSRAAIYGIAPPGSAAQYTIPALFRPQRIDLLAAYIGAVPIRTPLPDAPVHVMKTPGIRRKCSHRQGFCPVWTLFRITIRLSSINARLITSKAVPEMKHRARPGTARVLPLRLGWECRPQPLRYGAPSIHPADKLLAILPTLFLDRIVVPLSRVGF